MRSLAVVLVGTIVTGGAGIAQAQTSQAAPADNKLAITTKAGVDAWAQADYLKAVAIWRPLAKAGDPDAQFNLGQAYKLGRGVPVDLPIAAEWFRKAALQGHEQAEDNYGLLLFRLNKREEAMPFIRKSADRSEPRAQYILATALYNGDLAPRDWVRAYALMTQAAKAGLTPATASLEIMDQYIPETQRQQGLALATQMDETARQRAIADAASAAASAKAEPPAAQAAAPTTAESASPSAAATAKPAKVAAMATPTAKPAEKPAVARTGDWRIQLGAFSDEDRARSLWSSLSGKIKTLGGYQPYYLKNDAITRLQIGPLASQADAARLCNAVLATGADCMVKHK